MKKTCWLLQPPQTLKVVVVYIAVTNGGNLDSYAPRFARTYQEFPAGYPHKLIVACNGGELGERRKAYFDGIKCEFFLRHNDEGKDISAYQDVGRMHRDAFVVCFGESVYFHKEGWLSRLAEERMEHGEGMYGCFSSHFVRAHLNTTGFGTDARLLNQYPAVQDNGRRYEFEHGQNCYWKRISAGGHTARLVTWDGSWPPGMWRTPEKIMHKADQSNLLCFCNHTEKFVHANEATRSLWAAQSESPFRT